VQSEEAKQNPMQDLITHLVRPEIRDIRAYHVPEANGLVKLDAMENPYSWPVELQAEWLDLLRATEINRYPHPQAPEVQAALREAMDIPADMGLVLGNGSDELIQMLAMTLGGPRRKVLSVDPGFVMYRMIAVFTGMGYVGVPLHPSSFDLDLTAVLDALDREKPVLTYIAYPNNPTGNLFRAEDIVRIIEAAPGLVIIDEAYAPFTDASFLPRLGTWPNLLVMRTVSKMGLAGLRLGYLAGPGEWIEQIDKTRLPYNINVLTQASATLALRHRALFDTQTTAIRVERTRLYSALAALDGVQPYPSEANFILLRLTNHGANQVFAEIRERGILIKNLHGAHPLLTDCLRVTVGRPEEDDAFLAALAGAL
jgi:histidinol-phosphate aminotransferase